MSNYFIFVPMGKPKSNTFPLRGLGPLKPQLERLAADNFISVNSLILQALNDLVKKKKKVA